MNSRKLKTRLKQVLLSLVGRELYDQCRLFFRFFKIRARLPDYNDPILRFHRKLISEGDTILDVGSNRGYFTFNYSRMTGTSGKVYSFEPIAETFVLQRRLLSLLGVKNAVVMNFALGNKKGSAKMFIPKTGCLIEDLCAFLKTDDTPASGGACFRRSR